MANTAWVTFYLIALLGTIISTSNSVREVPLIEQVLTPHQFIIIQPGASDILTLQYLEGKATDLDFYLVNSTGTGKLFQLAINFVKHGYEPKNGEKIELGTMISGEKTLPKSSNAVSLDQKVAVTEPAQRIFYVRPNPDRLPTNSKYATIDYMVSRKSDGYLSQIGTIHIAPPTGAIVGSDFTSYGAAKANSIAALDGWEIIGNHHIVASVNGNVQPKASTLPSFERFRIGNLHNHYIVGKEDSIDIAHAEGGDRQLWYFQAPAKFLGNQGIAYRGHFSFALVSISGDFAQMNDLNTLNFVELECATCDGPVRKGLKIVYRVSQWPHPFTGAAQQIRIHLHEQGGWLKDSQDLLVPWSAPSQCDMLQVLGRLSAVRILGDFTKGFETIALDDVRFSNSKSKFDLKL